MRKSSRRSLGGIPVVDPERAGLNTAPLKRLRAATFHDVHKEGSLAGVAHLILRGGRCVFSHAAGWADRRKRRRFGFRTLCRLHGATKPLVAAAFFTLVDEGKVDLDDPVAKYLSFSSSVAKGSATRPARDRPTLRHLLTMTAGLKYQDCKAYRRIMSAVGRGTVSDLKGLCDELASVPLQLEPGSRHEYGFCTDVLGRICEAVSGQSLDKFVEERLLKPLGMKDTHFRLPPQKRRRAAVLYRCEYVPAKLARNGKPCTTRPIVEKGRCAADTLLSAGGGVLSYSEPGMWSTPLDYVRFCQMLQNGGVSASGSRILRSSTVRTFWRDSLAPYAQKDGSVAGWDDYAEGDPEETAFWAQHTWTLLNSTVEIHQPRLRPGKVTREGSCMWMFGGAGTGWAVDMKRGMIALSFAQNFGGSLWDRANGTGCYSLEFAKAAVDEGRATKRARS
mmetsp:Transcript_84459/g.149442  ORF Transcript_84459/g.149442 Transcript_84459/m.149442 type:complete len:448 (-) Transcript_84459:205-1548(-)|eukprot:CAMPEP_0197655316 /NCGR_PEP_ID=MMETSP1338-20131121/39381_1 /TAXON_ID=43686 ORGANISM="Pelagodinium beii, Strain RCC1491" /NCGR_SAMPLE_ID=MMETSP1338 /ASSEMBLY_ACC=CAM_ASM_000754 /LENGTH=447 /DNA_ID=CAMNT_0043230943 /DNA_START=44 /DNA_END=1387 /DNA_ORIENTATION=+